MRVYEEVELVEQLPTVYPYTSCMYTMPLLNSTFPDGLDASSDLKLHLSGVMTSDYSSPMGCTLEHGECIGRFLDKPAQNVRLTTC